MRRRPPALFAAGFWVMLSGFAQMRPLVHTTAPVLSPRGTDYALTILGLLVIVVVSGLLQMRPRFILSSTAICAGWLAILAARITLALIYSPEIFGPIQPGQNVYMVPVVTIFLNCCTVAYLCSPGFREAARRYRGIRTVDGS